MRLAGRGRRGRDAHVDVLAGHLAPDAAVLRQPLLGDVEPGHDLDARDDRRMELLRRALGLAQHAVDPVAHDDVLLAGPDVDIRRAILGGLEHQRVHPADDRRLVVGVEHVDELVRRVLRVFVGVLLRALFELGAAAEPRVDLVDVIDDAAARHDHRLDRLGEQDGDRVDDLDRVRIGDRDHDAAVLAAQRHDLALPGEVDRQLVDQVDRDVIGARQIAQVTEVELHRERLRELILVDELEPHEHLADQPALFALPRQRAIDRVGRDLAPRDEDLAEQSGACDACGVRHRYLPVLRRAGGGGGAGGASSAPFARPELDGALVDVLAVAGRVRAAPRPPRPTRARG